LEQHGGFRPTRAGTDAPASALPSRGGMRRVLDSVTLLG
jgi:hypothetical protein